MLPWAAWSPGARICPLRSHGKPLHACPDEIQLVQRGLWKAEGRPAFPGCKGTVRKIQRRPAIEPSWRHARYDIWNEALLRSRTFCRGRLIGRSVITAARTYRGIARRFNYDLDLPEGAIQSGIGRRVFDGLLIANVMRHLVRDAVDFGDVLGEKCLAAGRLGQSLQSALGALSLPAFFFAQQAYRVNQDAGLLGRLHQVFETHQAGVVVAVSDHYQHFLVFVPLFFGVV